MSSSMMRGIPLKNPSLSINMRNNLIIEIDDSNDDSDDNTLHIVEESIEESIEIDDSESDEQAIVSIFFLNKSLRSGTYKGRVVVFVVRMEWKNVENFLNNHFDAL